MYKSATTITCSSFLVVLFLYFGLTIEQEYYKNSILNHIEIFAQKER